MDGNLALNNEVRGNSLTAHILTCSLGGPFTPPSYYNYIFAGGASANGPDRLDQGFLAKKVPGVTDVQTVCVSMITGLTAGAFSLSDKNTVDLTDIVT